MIDGYLGLIGSFLRNCLKGLLGGLVVSVVGWILLFLLSIPCGLLLPAFIYNLIFGILGFMLSFPVVFLVIFISGMLEDYSAPSLRINRRIRKALK